MDGEKKSVRYFKKPNGYYFAVSSRGMFVYDDHSDIWLSTRGMIIDCDLRDAEETTAEMIEKDRRHNLLVSEKYKDSIFLKRISIRNEITSRLSLNDPTHDSAEDKYVNNIPVIMQLAKGRFLEISRPVTLIVGDNGTGKSTLLEAIAVGFGLNGEGGDSNSSFETRRDYSDLFKLVQIGRVQYPKDAFFLRAESFYNLATAVDDKIVHGYFGEKSFHKQSHGESFLSLVRNRFRGNGLYILDEPEAALSPKKVIQLMREIKRLTDDGSQFVIATHSPILMTFPDAQIFEFTQSGIYEKKYTELDSFNYTKEFLSNPEYYLRKEGL